MSRTITGIVLVSVLLAAILINQITFGIVFLAVLILSMLEFYKMIEKSGSSPQKRVGVASGIATFLISFLVASGYIGSKWYLILFLFALGIIIYELFRNQKTPFTNIAMTILGTLYIAVPLSLLWFFAYYDNINLYNYHFILGYFIFIWIYDTMAYLTGRSVGKNKLFERISPKKTWEGAIGGLVFTLLAAYILSMYFVDISSNKWMVFAAIVSIFGTLGDLVESMLKRSVDIKDSGDLLPGHGGFLDRFDAMFLAVPAVYIYLQLI